VAVLDMLAPDREGAPAGAADRGHPERARPGAVSAVVLQQALADPNAADRNSFVSIAGQPGDAKAGRPRFRSRKDRRQAIRFTANARFKVLTSGTLRLPKIGDVPVRWSRPPPSEPSWIAGRSWRRRRAGRAARRIWRSRR
jgi:putative transposase